MKTGEAQLIAHDMFDLGHFLFDGVSWEFYEYILEQRDRAGLYARITCDCGRMEILTGAGVAGELRAAFARMLEHFSAVGDVFPEESGSPRKASGDQIERDDIYVFTSKPGGGGWGRLDAQKSPQSERAIDVTVALRKVLTTPEATVDDSPRLRLIGRVIARWENGKYEPSVGSTLFPGISLAKHFKFFQYKPKEEKKR
jgi:hypothetical protein